jgi:shikimate dehydrogenase
MAQDRYHLAGVMGHPVLHSRSPMIHNHWLKEHGLKGAYVLLEVKQEGLQAALKALPALGFAGCNITIPHKEAAIAAMDSLDPAVQRIGAMNCVVVRPDGSLHGMNNDGYGWVESIKERFQDWRADAGPAVVLGAGGGARAVVSGLMDEGAREIRVLNRSRERAEKLAQDFGAPVAAHDWSRREEALADAAMVVNCTSLGMHGQPPLDVSLAKLPKSAIVSDIIYIPRETPLLAEARMRGNRTVNGLGMLLNQARPAFKAWFGVSPQVTPELRARIEESIG